jgi:predicted DNA-binding transcriptional regulator AlpA
MTTAAAAPAETAARAPERMTLDRAAQLGPDSLLTPSEVAQVLRVSEKTIERWRSKGTGPRHIKVGPRRVAYRVAEVLAFTQIAGAQ